MLTTPPLSQLSLLLSASDSESKLLDPTIFISFRFLEIKDLNLRFLPGEFRLVREEATPNALDPPLPLPPYKLVKLGCNPTAAVLLLLLYLDKISTELNRALTFLLNVPTSFLLTSSSFVFNSQ